MSRYIWPFSLALIPSGLCVFIFGFSCLSASAFICKGWPGLKKAHPWRNKNMSNSQSMCLWIDTSTVLQARSSRGTTEQIKFLLKLLGTQKTKLLPMVLVRHTVNSSANSSVKYMFTYNSRTFGNCSYLLNWFNPIFITDPEHFNNNKSMSNGTFPFFLHSPGLKSQLNLTLEYRYMHICCFDWLNSLKQAFSNLKVTFFLN